MLPTSLDDAERAAPFAMLQRPPQTLQAAGRAGRGHHPPTMRAARDTAPPNEWEPARRKPQACFQAGWNHERNQFVRPRKAIALGRIFLSPETKRRDT